MSKKIKDVADSIKSKLSFDDYTPSVKEEHNDTMPSNDIKTENHKSNSNTFEPTKAAPRHAYIYIMQKGNGTCKVGLSKTPENRADNLSLFLKTKMKIAGYYESQNCYFDEKKIHSILAEYSLGGEFFNLSYFQIKMKLEGIYNFIDYVSPIKNKVKRTFYLLESIAEELDALYVKKLSEKKKVDKSDIVTQGLKKLFEDPECEIKSF